jgi:hypothetical protein
MWLCEEKRDLGCKRCTNRLLLSPQRSSARPQATEIWRNASSDGWRKVSHHSRRLPLIDSYKLLRPAAGKKRLQMLRLADDLRGS